MMDKYGHRIPIESLKHAILRWLGLNGWQLYVADSEVRAKQFAASTSKELKNQIEVNESSTVSRFHAHLELIGNINSDLEDHKAKLEDTHATIKERVGAHVKEEMARLQASPHRHVACPTCGKSFDLSNQPTHTRSITICCDNCKNHFEIRPRLFWDKLEVERR